MRKIRYSVVMSLDGYIAGPNGEADWIIANPEMDFAALFGQFDTLLIGRKTYEFMVKMGQSSVPGLKIFVFSRTMRAANFPGVQVVAESVEKRVKALRGEEGKDIWVFGGGELFRGLLEARLVDTVEVGVIAGRRNSAAAGSGEADEAQTGRARDLQGWSGVADL